jgi:preprotein translocase subunit SecA
MQPGVAAESNGSPAPAAPAAVRSDDAQRAVANAMGVRAPRNLRTNQPSESGAGTTVVAKEKVGRNDPCPCGSGKKYKKCHGAA